jgi:hypothetical protein
MQPAGQDPEARQAPGTVTLPLRSQTNASPFWIMLLRVRVRLDHGMIPALAHRTARPIGFCEDLQIRHEDESKGDDGKAHYTRP